MIRAGLASVGADTLLRPLVAAGGTDAGASFERAGRVVTPGRRLGDIVRGRPPGITAHQWSSAARTPLAYVVGEAGGHAPVLAVEMHDPALRGPGAPRADRATAAVCAAVGLPLLRVESSACGLGSYARWIVEYVIDAHAYTTATAGSPDTRGLVPESPNYRDILGRLPDGRTGFVNDLGALARAAAVDAYVGGQIVDPIVRGLHVSWRDGAAEGWAWLDVREGQCLFERTRIWQYRFSCGVEPDRLAEDLAAAAVGERLRLLDGTEPRLRDRHDLARELDALKARGDEMAAPFAFDHVCF